MYYIFYISYYILHITYYILYIIYFIVYIIYIIYYKIHIIYYILYIICYILHIIYYILYISYIYMYIIFMSIYFYIVYIYICISIRPKTTKKADPDPNPTWKAAKHVHRGWMVALSACHSSPARGKKNCRCNPPSHPYPLKILKGILGRVYSWISTLHLESRKIATSPY